MDEIRDFKTKGILPTDRSKAKKLKLKASRFCLIDKEMYRRSFLTPLFKCVGPTDADYILREIHHGICGHHIGERTLAHKALSAGYYWPTMEADSKGLVRKYDKCQKFAP